MNINGLDSEMFGIERSVLSRNGESTWQSYFLKDGYESYVHYHSYYWVYFV